MRGEIYYPGARRHVTHLCIAAHQDDTEFMAYAPIAECFGRDEPCFGSVVVTDGANSPRSGSYAGCTAEEMRSIRDREQKRAAHLGGYGVQYLLGYSSSQVKRGEEGEVAKALCEIVRRERPRVIYTHNPADKHETHVAVCARTIEALRMLREEELPERVYGCEVWRSLDWLCDGEKVLLDCSAMPHLARALSGVFDSQISGGKRYDLAIEGRRLANATFFESHACDGASMLQFAADLTPLIRDRQLSLTEFVSGQIERFRAEAESTLRRVNASPPRREK